MNAPDLLQQLAEVGAERVEAIERAQSASTKLAAVADRAVRQGITKSEISRWAQISRPALDTMLKQQAPERQAILDSENELYIVFGPNGESRGGKPMPERVLHNTLNCRAGHPSVNEIWNTFHEAEVRIATPEGHWHSPPVPGCRLPQGARRGVRQIDRNEHAQKDGPRGRRHNHCRAPPLPKQSGRAARKRHAGSRSFTTAPASHSPASSYTSTAGAPPHPRHPHGRHPRSDRTGMRPAASVRTRRRVRRLNSPRQHEPKAPKWTLSARRFVLKVPHWPAGGPGSPYSTSGRLTEQSKGLARRRSQFRQARFSSLTWLWTGVRGGDDAEVRFRPTPTNELIVGMAGPRLRRGWVSR